MGRFVVKQKGVVLMGSCLLIILLFIAGFHFFGMGFFWAILLLGVIVYVFFKKFN